MTIEPVLIEQILVSPRLDYFSLVDDDDEIDIAYGAEPVRDNETGAALHQREESFLDSGFGSRIDAARRLVEYQNRGVGENRARRSRPLVRKIYC